MSAVATEQQLERLERVLPRPGSELPTRSPVSRRVGEEHGLRGVRARLLLLALLLQLPQVLTFL